MLGFSTKLDSRALGLAAMSVSRVIFIILIIISIVIFIIQIIILNLHNLSLSGFAYNIKPESLRYVSGCKAMPWKCDN